MNKGRYQLQKLIAKDDKFKLEKWADTGIGSDDLKALDNFSTAKYRIYDTLEEAVVIKKDIEKWKFWLE